MGPREHPKQAFLAVSCRFWPSYGRCARETAKNGQKRPVDARWPRGRPVHASEPWVTSLLCSDRSRNAETRANYWINNHAKCKRMSSKTERPIGDLDLETDRLPVRSVLRIQLRATMERLWS